MNANDWKPVVDWHRVVNTRDIDGASIVVTPDIEVGGPKGRARGIDVFVSWVAQAGIHLQPLSYRPVSSIDIIVEQAATWPGSAAAETGAAPITVATLFRLEGSRVCKAVRFDSVDEALAAVSAEGG